MLTIPGYRLQRIQDGRSGKYSAVEVEPIDGGSDPTIPHRLLPGGIEVRIKGVEDAPGRKVLALKGARRTDLRSGAVLIGADWPVVETRTALLLSDGQAPPAGPARVHGGPCPDFNRDDLVGPARFGVRGSFVEVRFPSAYPLMPGMELRVTDARGLRRYDVLWPGQPDAAEMRRLEKGAARRPDPHPAIEELYGRLLHVRGWAALPPNLDGAAWSGGRRIGRWAIRDRDLPILEKHILKSCARPGGAAAEDLDRPPWPRPLLRALADDLVRRERLERRNDRLFPPGPPRLSPFHRSWLRRIQDAGGEGIRLRSLRTDADRRALEDLARAGLIRGGQELWLSKDAVDLLRERLLDGHSPGDRITMAETRERLGGTRPRAVELLGILDADGVLAPGPRGDGRVLT